MRWKVPDIKGWERVQVWRCKVTVGVCSNSARETGLRPNSAGESPASTHMHEIEAVRQIADPSLSW